MESNCRIAKYLRENYADEIEKISRREQVDASVAICSHLCPEVVGCIEDVEDQLCALRLRTMSKE
ncbi:MAG: hypothetical protein VR69_16310 [Peptococcaceae bacterium BRH_c4b]|nr:MAG: hypothetical protein VR69_16310 [Peptococcaceae bacterium BRH_c4b]